MNNVIVSSDVLRVAAIQATFYLGSGTKKTGQADCIKLQDGGQPMPVFALPDVPPKSDAVQFVMAVEVGEGGVCFTMWSAVQPIREGRLFLEALRK
jgi:hypothetical protein